jgi:hypothetical protein
MNRKNLKLGVITFHNTSNYGAALQAFAFIAMLQEQGFYAEVIDYSNKYRDGKYSGLHRIFDQIKQGNYLQALKFFLSWPGIIARNRNFKTFYRNHLSLSKAKYYDSDSLKNDSKNYDAIIAGSDQIWNYKNNGLDFNYLLEFVSDDVKKISYSSSFGLVKIPNRLKDKYSFFLNRIDFISVREETAQSLVKSLTGKLPFLAVDPVLLQDVNFWDNVSDKIKFKSREYDLYYLNDNYHWNSQIINLTKSPKRQIKVSLGSFKLSSVLDSLFYVRNADGPASFITYIKNARIVYTTSFHALVFCLIYNVPFYVFLSGDTGRDSRLLEMLSSFDLLDRAVYKDTIPQSIENAVDFTKFNNLSRDLRDKSKTFLLDAIKSSL